MTQPKKPAGSPKPRASGAGAQRSRAASPSTARKPATASQARKPAARKPTGASTARRPAARPAAPPPQAEAAAPGPEVAAAPAARAAEDVEQRLQQLNDRIITAGKKVGLVSLDLYESTLESIAVALERGAAVSDVEWVSKMANSQAEFLREAAKAWTSAARGLLK